MSLWYFQPWSTFGLISVIWLRFLEMLLQTEIW
jgi:hypothetical protein